MSVIMDDLSLKDIIHKLRDWVKYIRSKWVIVLLFGVVGACIGFGYASVKKPIYHANLTFALEDKSAGGSGLSSIASTFGLSFGSSDGGAFAGDNIIELMKSRLLIEKTLLTKVETNGKDKRLIDLYLEINKLNEDWKNKPAFANLDFNNTDSLGNRIFNRVTDSIKGQVYRLILKDNISVSKIDKKLSIISVQISSTNEQFSKLFCENLVKNVTDFYIETKIGKSKKNVDILQLRVDSVKRELDMSLYGRAIFTDRNFGLVRQSASVPKQKQEINVQMLGAMYTELVKNLELSKLSLMREEPLIQIIDTPILPLERERLGRFKTMLTASIFFGIISIFIIVILKFFRSSTV